jgi:hypothetical protein
MSRRLPQKYFEVSKKAKGRAFVTIFPQKARKKEKKKRMAFGRKTQRRKDQISCFEAKRPRP